MSQEMAIFVRAAERGSFTAAAQESGLTPSAVSKLIGRLEERLGTRLLNRTTRKIALTPAGEVYFERSRQILAEISDVEAEIQARGNEPRGPLRINIGIAFATHQVAQVMPEFMLRYPLLEPQFDVNDNIVDLLEANADLAIRTGQVTDTALIQRKISDLYRIICATPEYLQRHGTPRRPQDLLRHECLTLSNAPTLSKWPFIIDGTVETIQVSAQIETNNAEVLLQLALAGAGIIRVGENLITDHLRDGRLVPLLVDCHYSRPTPVSAVYPEGRHRSPAVRAFTDFLIEKLAGAPWRVPGCVLARK